MGQTENTLIETLADILGDDFITKISTARFDTNREKISNAVGKEKIQLLFKDGSEVTLTINKKKLNLSIPELAKIEIQRKYPETNLIIFKLLKKTRSLNDKNIPYASYINVAKLSRILAEAGSEISRSKMAVMVNKMRNTYTYYITENIKYDYEDDEVQDTELLEKCFKECLRINK